MSAERLEYDLSPWIQLYENNCVFVSRTIFTRFYSGRKLIRFTFMFVSDLLFNVHAGFMLIKLFSFHGLIVSSEYHSHLLPKQICTTWYSDEVIYSLLRILFTNWVKTFSSTPFTSMKCIRMQSKQLGKNQRQTTSCWRRWFMRCNIFPLAVQCASLFKLKHALARMFQLEFTI